MSRPVVILEIEAGRMLAIEARLAGSRVRVRRSVCVDGVPEGEAEDTGRWVRETLRERGFKAGTAIVAVSRGHVITKRLDAPAGELSPSERHEMIRLQMARQASLTSGESVIDYIERRDAAADETPSGIIAAAMPAEHAETRRAVVKAAGLKLAGIRLRSSGVRAVLSGLPEDAESDGTLVIVPGAGSVEILVVAGGEVAFSRSIDAAQPAGDAETDSWTNRIAVEASRSVVSYRVSPGGRDVDRVIVIADDRFARRLADAASDRLEIRAEVLEPGEMLEFDEAVEPGDRARALPLAGLLLCERRGLPVLDFANPTGPPDTSASLRQAVLAGMFLLVILGGAGYLLAERQLAGERTRLEAAKTEHDNALEKYIDAQLVGARLGHMRAWSSQPIDELAHLGAVVDRMPGPTEGALSELNAEIAGEVRFVEGKQLNDPEAWRVEPTLVLRLAGAVRHRRYAQVFRKSLLDTEAFNVSSQGPEVENRFALVVSTAQPSPAAFAEPGDAPPADGGGEP